jgi:hypothetical protein
MHHCRSLLVSIALQCLLSLFAAANAAETRLVVAYSSINPNSSHLELALVKPDDLIDDSIMRKFDSSGILDRALAGSL